MPPPETLEKYNNIEPGFANRIMVMAESQSRHRQAMEKFVVEAKTRYEGRSQILAAIIALVLGGGSIWLISIGKSIEGVSAIIAELVAFTWVFIYGRKRQERELTEKKRALTSSA